MRTVRKESTELVQLQYVIVLVEYGRSKLTENEPKNSNLEKEEKSLLKKKKRRYKAVYKKRYREK